MTENKSTVLTIYSRSPLKYRYKTEGQECIFNAPAKDAAQIEEYVGDAINHGGYEKSKPFY